MIDEMKAEFGVGYLAEKLGVTSRGYAAWKKRPVSAAAAARWELDTRVWRRFVDTDRAEGHRKVTAALAAAGTVVDRKTVHSSMRRQGLMPPAAEAAFRRALRRQRAEADPDDLLRRDFSVDVVGTALVSDITYVATKEGWVYLATVIDLASRAVLGAATGKRQTAALIVKALNRALATGHVQKNAIFHSDHGSQYRSKTVRNFCRRHQIRRSMGARFQCWDNAVAEGFFSRLKNERLRWMTFATRGEATRAITTYIRYFNEHRHHQHLGYSTPIAALTQLTTPTAAHVA